MWKVEDTDEYENVFIHSFKQNDLTAYVSKQGHPTKFYWFIERTHVDMKGETYYTGFPQKGRCNTLEEAQQQAEKALAEI